LPMQVDPVLEWQRLTAEYREKGEGELLELARDYADLTEPAQQALRAEMRSRGLGDPESPRIAPEAEASQPISFPSRPADSIAEPQSEVLTDQAAGLLGLSAGMPRLVPDQPESDNGDNGPHEYTWKTPLCDCETNDQAQQLTAVLRQAGIDSWIQQAREFGRRNARVMVAADQLDQAQAVAAQFVPQKIAEDATEEVPEFVEPKCPKCGSEDVVLEGVDPENIWRCEQCDEQWTETAPAIAGEGPKE